MSTTSVGNKGEDLACEYLKKQGYKILERNFRIRGGEIDIIAKDKEYLVFIEVKTRYTHQFGVPEESITPWKIKYLLHAAKFYLNKINYGDGPYRLDALLIDYLYTSVPEVNLIKNITG